MNSPTTELNTTLSKQEYVGTDDPSSRDCSSEKDTTVHNGPAGTSFWTVPSSDASLSGILPHPHQHTIQPRVVDPLSLRFHCPCQSTQCQMTYPDYLLDHQASQYHLFTGPMPVPPDSSHHSSFSAPWFINEPVLCSMMPGDLHTPVANICVPQAMDHQQVQEGLTEVTTHITQPVVCNVSGGGQVVVVNHCEPAPVFLTLESAPTHRDDRRSSRERHDCVGES
ncbi:spexin prohormone 2 isoform X2 [Lates calcarifer]|uniref:Spexin prohormone 2 isoform X2 n=1 Tax=Lates calcarifer TaxID=8187 RepID=A0AAJ7LWP2_LATCA|nr:spexin prohormone 2 isoform X2 [Lates calcarifer]